MTRSYEPDRDALLLAAYLDGRLSEAEAAEAEALIARDPEALEAVLAASAALDEPVEAAPASLIARAQGIVQPPAKPQRARGGVFGFLKPALMTSAVTAAFLIAAVGAFEAGRIGANSAEAYQTLTSEILLPNPSRGLEG